MVSPFAKVSVGAVTFLSAPSALPRVILLTVTTAGAGGGGGGACTCGAGAGGGGAAGGGVSFLQPAIPMTSATRIRLAVSFAMMLLLFVAAPLVTSGES